MPSRVMVAAIHRILRYKEVSVVCPLKGSLQLLKQMVYVS